MSAQNTKTQTELTDQAIVLAASLKAGQTGCSQLLRDLDASARSLVTVTDQQQMILKTLTDFKLACFGVASNECLQLLDKVTIEQGKALLNTFRASYRQALKREKTLLQIGNERPVLNLTAIEFKPIEDKKTENKTEEKKTENKTEEKKTENKTEEKKTENKAEEKKTENKTEDKIYQPLVDKTQLALGKRLMDEQHARIKWSVKAQKLEQEARHMRHNMDLMANEINRLRLALANAEAVAKTASEKASKTTKTRSKKAGNQ